MTLGELLTKEGITLTNHDRNRIGILIGAKAKELDIAKTRKEESYEGKHYTANDYDEAFAGDMIIVREFIANPPMPTKDITDEQLKKIKVPPKKVRVEPVSKPKAEEVKHVQSDAGKKRQQEWLEKRRNAK